MDREAYVGICEDVRVGVSLIFHLQNTVEYIKEKQLSGDRLKFGSVTGGAVQFRDSPSSCYESKETERRRRRNPGTG